MAIENRALMQSLNDQFLDVLCMAGVIFNGIVLAYVVIRLERAIGAAGERLRAVFTHQQETHRSINTIWTRINEIENRVGMKNDLQSTLAAIAKRLNDLEQR
jgi:hypothetical protein